MDVTVPTHPQHRLQLRRIARRVRPAAVLMLVYAAWELLPAWLPYFWALVPRPVQRTIATGFLNGLLASYAAVLVLEAVGLAE